MRSRTRAPDDGDQALQRVTQVLATSRAGWVPPPETLEVSAPDPSDVDAAPADPAPADPAPADPAPVAPATAESAPARPTPAERRQADRSLTGWLPATLRAGRVDLTRGAVLGLLVVALVAALVTVAVLLRGRPVEVQVDTPRVVSVGTPLPGLSPRPAPPGASAGPDTELVIAVAGKVVHPGLVRLPGGSRVDDAVRAAGGAAPGVDLGTLNLARKLVDGEQILVGIDPPPGAVAAPEGPAGGGGPAAGRPDGLLDLNAAGVGDFDALPGIGPVLAQRIVDWREQHGPFRSVDQLREVTGIGEAKYADLESKVAV